MLTLAVMLLGVLAGRFFPAAHKSKNEKLQLACTLALIFAMGVSLGSGGRFFSDLAFIGGQSLLFCLVPTAGSIAAVYLLSRRFMDGAGAGAGEGKKPAVPASGDPMVFLAAGSLAAGLAGGAWPVSASFLAPLAAHSDGLLLLLMLSVGVSVGMRRGLLTILRHYHVKILAIPAGIIAGSLAGGALLALVTDWSLGPALSVAGSLGWYSLAGAAISRLAGPEIGSIAFLASLLRELLSFFLIPILARRLNGWTAIAPAAATSEDTTLPMLIRYTNEETAVFAVVNGILCSAAVPVILPLCY